MNDKIVSVFDGVVCNTGFFYRIPSVIKLNNGDLIAFADERVYSNKDNPNLINKVMRVSHDLGSSWEEKRTIVKCSGTSELTSTAAIDPCVLYDRINNVIYMIYCFTPEGVGLYNSERSIGNLIDSIVPTSYLMLVKSFDGGMSWSTPINLNEMVKESSWAFIGACPGIGIKLENGKYKNRLIFPIYYSGNKIQPSLMARVIYSDDGSNWFVGKDIVDYGLRRIDGIFDNEELMITECQVVEIKDKILIYCRNHSNKRKVGVAESADGGLSWTNYHLIDIDQPICQISALRFTRKEGDLILIANPCNPKERINGKLHYSYDGGVRFTRQKRIVPGFFSYSSIVQLDSKSVGILYEDSFETIKFIKLKI